MRILSNPIPRNVNKLFNNKICKISGRNLGLSFGNKFLFYLEYSTKSRTYAEIREIPIFPEFIKWQSIYREKKTEIR